MIQKYAFEQLGCDVEIIWHKSKEYNCRYRFSCDSWWFSYGDYLWSGAIARFANIMESVKENNM